jgi:hypothetical protein
LGDQRGALFQEDIDSRPLHSSPLDFLYFIFLIIPSRYPTGTRWVFQANRNNRQCFKNEHFVMLTSLLYSVKVFTNTLCVFKIKQGFASTHGTFVIFRNNFNGFWDFLSVTRVGTGSPTATEPTWKNHPHPPWCPLYFHQDKSYFYPLLNGMT